MVYTASYRPLVSLLNANAESLVTTPLNIACDGIELLIHSQEGSTCCNLVVQCTKKYHRQI